MGQRHRAYLDETADEFNGCAKQNQIKENTGDTMKTKFQQMVELQNKLNTNTNGENWTKGITNKGREINWFRCIYMECAEAIDSLNWKHWKDINSLDDIENVKVELVDIWHFIMSEEIATCGTDRIDKAVNYLFTDYVDCIKPDTDMLIDILESIMQKASIKINPSMDFFKAVIAVPDFTMEDVYILYIGKNCLNQFRQDHGYKEGTYLKIWDGAEDNVFMQQTLENNKDITYDELYALLETKYAEVVNNG